MTIITKSGLDAVHAAVRAENLTLPNGINANNVRLSDAQPIALGRTQLLASGRYGHGYRGRVAFKYTQLNLGVLFGGRPLVVYVEQARNMHEQLADIFYYTGVQLYPADVENTPPPQSELPYVSTLSACPSSAGYKGSVDVHFEYRDKRIDELVPWSDHDVTIAPFDAATTNRSRGEFLTYGTDYSLSSDELNTMDLGVLTGVRAQRLAAALTLVDGNPWTAADSVGFWSLLNARVSYNGRVSAYVSDKELRLPKSRFSHVALIEMEADRGAGDLYGSRLFIHYNVME